MKRALLVLLFAATGAPCAPARDSLAAIDDCLARLDREIDVGYARIAARCPELTPALTASPFTPWLPAGWNRPDNQLSAGGLSELRVLLARAAAPVSAGRAAPRPERVAAVLAAVTGSDAGGASWWQRFKDWLRRLLATRAENEDHWLARWLTQVKLTTSTTELIVWGALTVVVILAAAIVGNELRIAGLLGGRARGARGGAAQPATSQRPPGLAEIERAEPERQPGLLLELIAARLAAQERLPPARALTARELEQRARLPDESGRTYLGELVGVCERLRFSAKPVSAPSLAAALHGGRVLLAALDAAPHAAAAVPVR